MQRDGALAEMWFHVTRGQPIPPSVIKFHIFGLRVKLARSLRLADLNALVKLGVDVGHYGQLEHARRSEEYSRTQEISEVAHFLDFDGLIVPSARWQCENVILFTDRVPPDALSISRVDGEIDWMAWRSTLERQP
jgi:hypothetical protein